MTGTTPDAKTIEISERISTGQGPWVLMEEAQASRSNAGPDLDGALSEEARRASNRKRVQAASAEPALAGLNNEQLEAVTTDALRCRVIAGAGTGKTHVMVEKARRWVRDGIDPARIAFVTFTRKAAHEISERTPELETMTVGTIHHLGIVVGRKLGEKQLRVAEWAVNGSSRLRTMAQWLIEDLDRDPMLRRQLERLSGDENDAEEAVLGAAQAADEWIRTVRRSVDGQAPSTQKAIPCGGTGTTLVSIAKRLMDRYTEALSKESATDFEGIIAQARNAAIAKREGSSPWDRIIVDEWQDVNTGQSAFIHALASMTNSDGEQARLTVVGDDWQSIFGFQGGEVELLRGFTDPSGRACGQCETIALTQTYRFGQATANTTRAFVTRHSGGDDKVVIGRKDAPTDLNAPAPIQVASTLAHERSPDDGLGCTRAIAETLRYIAADPDMKRVLLLARERRTFANRRGTLAERTERILEEWRTNPERLPKYLIGRNTEKIERAAVTIAATPDGFDHKRIDALAKELSLKFERSTIHGAKGREADCVIILDAAETTPEGEAKLALARVLAGGSAAAKGERRRIWYVALTRARRSSYILVPPDHVAHSAFADELWRGDDPVYDVGENALAAALRPMRPMQPCPACRKPDNKLKTVEGERGAFVSCSGWRPDGSGCNHTERRCHACSNGIMSRAPGARVARCTNPECRATAPLCACSPPRAMVIRKQRTTGHEFWGCQRYGREDSCALTRRTTPAANAPARAGHNGSPSRRRHRG